MSLKKMSLEDIKKNLQCWKNNEILSSRDCNLLKDIPFYFQRIADEYYWGGFKSRMLDDGKIYLCTNKFDFSALSIFSSSINHQFFISSIYPQHELKKINTAFPKISIINDDKINFQENMHIILYADDKKCLNYCSMLYNNRDYIKNNVIKIFILTSNLFTVEYLKNSSFDVICTYNTHMPVYEICTTTFNLPHLFNILMEMCKYGYEIKEDIQFAINTARRISAKHGMSIDPILEKISPSMTSEQLADHFFNHSGCELLHNIIKSFLSIYKSASAEKLLWYINKYLQGCLVHYSTETYNEAQSGKSSFFDITPLAFSSQEEADTYYVFRGQEIYYLGLPQEKPSNYPLTFSNQDLTAGVRLATATSMVEFLLVALKNSDCPKPYRWLDLACGGGEIINFINLDKIGLQPDDIEFVGVDASSSEIEWAQRVAQPGRTFFCQSVFALPDAIRQQHFDIITAFEFLEHILDPLTFLRSLSTFQYRFFLCGSPLNQQVPLRAGIIHAWAFSHDGYKHILEASGHTCLYSSSAYIGKYIGSGWLDWCTCIGSRYGSFEKSFLTNL